MALKRERPDRPPTVGHVRHDSLMRVDRRVKQILARREAALQQALRAAERLKRAATGRPEPAAPDGGRSMASSVEIHRAAHDAFNERDWERMRSLMADTIAYSDRPRGLELGSFDEFPGWLKEWTTGMSPTLARTIPTTLRRASIQSAASTAAAPTTGRWAPPRPLPASAWTCRSARSCASRTDGSPAARSSTTS